VAQKRSGTRPSAKPAAKRPDPLDALKQKLPPAVQRALAQPIAKPPTSPLDPAHKPQQPARREEVLEAALALISEHGVAGASLRKLATRLGMSQPSLYHYFPSKDALVTEIVDYSTARMLGIGLAVSPPSGIADIPRFVKEATIALYATESHPRFVRFLFSVAIESPKHRALVERMFEERLRPSFGMLAEMFTRDPAERDELRDIMRMVVYSLGFMLLEERAIFGKPEARPHILQYAEWVRGAAETLIAARLRAP
jgi:AcrR family transcriptional regulator